MEFTLLEGSVLVGGQEGTTNAEVAQPSDTSGSGSSSGGTSASSFSMMSLIFIYVVIFAAIYFLTMRPARKREAAIQEKQDQLRVNDPVVTSSGMHGKVVDIGTDTFSIEFGSNKSIIIPVSKRDVFPVGINFDEKPEKKKKNKKNEDEQ